MIVVVILKLNKLNMFNPNTSHSIALLKCLSKLLEKIIAKCITYEAGRHNLISINQLDGHDKSSIIDACLSLTHDIQAAWHNGLTASAFTIDTKGYSNNISHNCLTHPLQLLGFSPQIMGWAHFFLKGWKVLIHINDQLATLIPLPNIDIP